jgi:hypothetical protein
MKVVRGYDGLPRIGDKYGPVAPVSTTRSFADEQRDMEEAHAEGLHDEIPRDFCPDCGQRLP